LGGIGLGYTAQTNLAARCGRQDDVLGLNPLEFFQDSARGIAETCAALPHLQALPQHEGKKASVPSFAQLQSGSTGGSIGKSDKSISGGEIAAEPSAPPKSRSKSKRPADSETSDQSSSARKCANIEGAWNSSAPSSVSENIRQSGCNFSGTLTNAFFNHAISGKYLGGSNYSISITRTNKSNGCTTVMHGRMNLISGAEFQTITAGTDGRCDLPVNFAETRVWTR
jgi:hypothetical protein